MRDKQGFDMWATQYDGDVGVCERDNKYPFAGYGEVHDCIYREVAKKPSAAVLDVGFGTGKLTSRFYESGCTVYGQDFSSAMIEAARVKMPNAHLYRGDFHAGLVPELLQNTYDFVVATYSLHHLNDEEKVVFIRTLREHLNPGGSILIGDVAFETEADLEKCRSEVGDAWDKEEFYFVCDRMRGFFPELKFYKKSYCAGVLSLAR